ncbi:hypothetical protein C1646_753532 [Rhizophagus diaphanus]|nr:hypothetical protein C1646_753532 [Rhizophagus diaphanus] [Rhizophagus sp. MUCL 43196]
MSESWVKMCTKCPSCPSEYATFWKHKRSECTSNDSNLYWSNNARVKCNICNNPSHITAWGFRCHGHSDYRQPNKTEFASAVMLAISAKNEGKISWEFAEQLLGTLKRDKSRWN